MPEKSEKEHRLENTPNAIVTRLSSGGGVINQP
jgi:hypothetical protein